MERSGQCAKPVLGGENPLQPFPTQEPLMSENPYSACMAECNNCADACDNCATACLAEDNVGMMQDCIRHDLDCAALCRLAAGYMARGSAHASEICTLCAQVCEVCAAECAKHEHPHCQACAQACRRCAEECRKMIAYGRALG